MNSPQSQKTEDKDDLPSIEQLKTAAKLSNIKLAEVKTVFPFVLFPNRVLVDKSKVDIVRSTFFYSRQTFTILIKDLVTVRISTSYFFATLYFEISGYEKNPGPINYLPKEDAYDVKRIIMGLVTCNREGIDVSKLEKDELRSYLLKIGKANEDVERAV